MYTVETFQMDTLQVYVSYKADNLRKAVQAAKNMSFVMAETPSTVVLLHEDSILAQSRDGKLELMINSEGF